jgi:hypothetical protein
MSFELSRQLALTALRSLAALHDRFLIRHHRGLFFTSLRVPASSISTAFPLGLAIVTLRR